MFFIHILTQSFCAGCYTCVMEPPGLVEEMSGGGSVRGLTAAIRPLSGGRLVSEGWPACWNAGGQER